MLYLNKNLHSVLWEPYELLVLTVVQSKFIIFQLSIYFCI